GIRDRTVTGVQTCALPISAKLVFKRRFANDVARSPADALKEIIVPKSARSVQGLSENYQSRPENCSAVSRIRQAPHRADNTILEIGRASCRERMKISVVEG